MRCLPGTTPPAHHCCWRSHIPRQQLGQEELVNQEAFSMTGHLPSEPIMRAKDPCLLLVISFPYFLTFRLISYEASWEAARAVFDENLVIPVYKPLDAKLV